MWIERLFSKFAALYGASFGRQWEGTNLEEVKGIWAEKLGGFSSSNIKTALDACDERPYPPNLPEFVTLCRNAAIHQRPPVLESKPVLPAPNVLERVGQLAHMADKPKPYDFKLWAKNLRAEYLDGVCLTQMQIAMASEALLEQWDNRKCSPRVTA